MRNRLFWASVILSSALVDIPRRLQVGAITAGGLLTVSIVLGIAAIALRYPAEAWRRLMRIWPMTALFLYSLLQCFWHSPSLQGYQNLCALWVFFVPIACISMERHNQTDPRYLARLQLLATALAATIYAVQIFFDGFGPDGLGSDALISARPFALYTLVGLALLLGRWAFGSRSSFWLAVGLTLLIALSLSRTALAVGVLLFPIARLRAISFRGLARVAVVGSVAAIALLYVVVSSSALSWRFLGGQRVQDFVTGDAAVNTSGRLEFWAITLASFKESPWLGKGPGTANDLIGETTDDILHPHNEYLRFLHDHGILGLSLYLIGAFQLLWMCWRDYRRRAIVRSPSASLSLGTFLAFLGVLLTMVTCNTASYTFVMAPLGTLIGASLAYRESSAGAIGKSVGQGRRSTIGSPGVAQPAPA